MERLKVVFHPKYFNSTYAMDPAASAGRLESIMNILERRSDLCEIVSPSPASEEDLLRAHTERQLRRIQADPLLYEIAALAAGGAVLAAKTAYAGNPSFAVIRPPGHHASADSCWGFCYFNNISVSLLRLFAEKKIKSAFLLDFDLHTGDGNINILENRTDGLQVDILNPMAGDSDEYLQEVEDHMKTLGSVDIFVASAGFDQGLQDWGNLLSPEDYHELGRLMKEYSGKLCQGRRYALLEGGYNHGVLGMNAEAFCEGFR